MKDLLYKEFKLAMHPTIFIFIGFGVLLLIPDWPFFLAFMYLFIAIMNTFIDGRTNQDVFFTAFLPVRKTDVVRARMLAVLSVEILQIAAAVPFAVLHTVIYNRGNQAGMTLNFAFFGVLFLMYTIFNSIFFPRFYKTAYKVGIPVLLGVLASLFFVGVIEFAIHAVPVLKVHLNTFGTNHLGSQFAVLAAGILIFSIGSLLTFRRASKNFEKVDI